MGWQNRGLAAALVIVTLVAYKPAYGCKFIWDDDHYVTDNLTLRSVDGLRRIWFEPGATPQYYPLVFTSFWLEYQLADPSNALNPAGYHIVNVALHALSAVLLWHVLRRLQLPGAWFAAAIFALHPVHVESVAWITERKNVLSGLFFWAALLAYARFSRLDADHPPAEKGWSWYALSLGFFLCALLSKTVTCSLPAVLVLLLWWKHDKVQLRDWLALSPFFILGAALAFVTVWMEKHHVGAAGEDWALSPIERCLVAGRSLWFYAGKLVWPVDLTFIYPRWSVDVHAWWQYLFPLAAVLVLLVLFLARSRLGKGPLVACLVFAGMLVPALGFFDVYPMRYSFVADHFQYLASVGLTTLAVMGAARLFRQLIPAATWPGVATGVAVLAVLAVLTWRQQAAYADPKTLWKDTLEKNPASWMAHYNLGTLYYHRDRLEEAEAHLSDALRENPRLAEAHNNLGNIAFNTGRFEEAVQHFKAALAIDDPRRNLVVIHQNLGLVLMQQGKLAAAIEHFSTALNKDPNSVSARVYLASAEARRGHLAEAEQSLCKVLADDPDSAEAYNELGEVQTRQGKLQEAIDSYQKAATLQPAKSTFRMDLAIALYRGGQRAQSASQQREVQQLNPHWPEVFSQAALKLASDADSRIRNGELAVELARAACEATGFRWPPSLDALAAALAEIGKFKEAIVIAKEALALASAANRREVKQLQERLALYERGQPVRKTYDDVIKE
jgi:tetratricopeptide (TPR) repeat protein